MNAEKDVRNKGVKTLLAGNMRILVLSIVITASFVSVSFAESNNYIPPAGYVPDADTAIKIAVAVWIPIYGEDHIRGEAPYQAELINDVWHVRGSLPGSTESKDEHGNTGVEVTVGGVAEAEISKTTGEILRIIHGK